MKAALIGCLVFGLALVPRPANAGGKKPSLHLDLIYGYAIPLTDLKSGRNVFIPDTGIAFEPRSDAGLRFGGVVYRPMDLLNLEVAFTAMVGFQSSVKACVDGRCVGERLDPALYFLYLYPSLAVNVSPPGSSLTFYFDMGLGPAVMFNGFRACGSGDVDEELHRELHFSLRPSLGIKAVLHRHVHFKFEPLALGIDFPIGSEWKEVSGTQVYYELKFILGFAP